MGPVKVSWYHLHLYIPQRDVRKLIYQKLRYADRCIAQIAHGSKTRLRDPHRFAHSCAVYGYVDLLGWAYSADYRFKTKSKLRLNGSWDEKMNYDLFGAAVFHGHGDVIDWLRTHGFGCERRYYEYEQDSDEEW